MGGENNFFPKRGGFCGTLRVLRAFFRKISGAGGNKGKRGNSVPQGLLGRSVGVNHRGTGQRVISRGRALP